MFQMRVSCRKSKRGPGYWKFNKMILHDIEYVNRINQIIEEQKKKHERSTPDKRWECCMDAIITYTKFKSKQNAKQHKERLNFLLKSKENSQIKIIQGDAAAIEECRKYEAEIERLIEARAQGAMFRSKARYARDYERNSKFFFSLEKSNYEKKNMKVIHTEQGEIVKDPNRILQEQRKFYKDLYTRDDKVKFQLCNESFERILSREDRIRLDSDIKLEELNAAIKSFKPNKTPGNLGLTAEFFQFFWSKIRWLYLDTINHAKKIGKLHLSARRGIISLIPKRGKNPNYLKHWRPLTMLNLSYKILAKVLAMRMKSVYPEIISETQTGFMEGRQITSTIRTVIDIAFHNKIIQGYLLTLDFLKCFDRIEYGAITGSLEYLGFGKEFIAWSELLFNEFQSATCNNGYFSEYFDVSRSCHQGCPAAPLFYNACGEVLAREIRKKTTIKGIKINDLEQIIAQFADDTQLFLANQKAVEEAIQVLSSIEANTGFAGLILKSLVYIG